MESFRDMFGGIPRAYIMSIPCTGTVEERTGSENRLVDVIIYAQIPSIPWVHFSPHHPTFGTGVPCPYKATSTGFSFSGTYPACTAGGVCDNGEKLFTQTYADGELNTSLEPNELSFTYFIYTYCGDVVTCVEKGTFKGTRTKGYSKVEDKWIADTEGTGLEGKFWGTQTWTVDCCTERQSFGSY
jgi:hypothetical protein